MRSGAAAFMALRAPCNERRSLLAHRLQVASGRSALQPVPGAVTAAATADTVGLPGQVTLVSVLLTPEATRVRDSPVEVAEAVARWLAPDVFLTVSTTLGLVATRLTPRTGY